MEEEVDSGKNQLAEFMERVKYIPLRLTLSERKLLRLCEASLNVTYWQNFVILISGEGSARLRNSGT